MVLAYLPMLVAALRDWLRFGQIHPAWLYVGPARALEQSVEFACFGSGVLPQFSQLLYAILS